MPLSLFRPGRIVALVILVVVGASAWWAWQRVHATTAASLPVAIRDVRAASSRLVGVPAAGVYSYTVTGSEKVGVGPLRISRRLPRSALLVVSAVPSGPGLRSIDTRLSGDHSESWRVRVTRRGGLVGVARGLRFGILGFGRTVSGDVSPPVLLRPRRIRLRMPPWTATYAVAGIAFHRTARVVRHELVTIAGVAVKTWVIATDETSTGVLHGTEHEEDWWAPALGIDVRREITRNLAGTAFNGLKATLVLSSTSPRR